jgi:hypothetical protein
VLLMAPLSSLSTKFVREASIFFSSSVYKRCIEIPNRLPQSQAEHCRKCFQISLVEVARIIVNVRNNNTQK